MAKETNITALWNQKLEIIYLIWFLATVVLLTVILKPYNKAYSTLSKPSYAFYNQSPDEEGYVVDYDGVMDFVVKNQRAQAELLLVESAKLRLRTNGKSEQSSGKVIYSLNGYPEDSTTINGTSKVDNIIHLHKNDYLRITAYGGAHTEFTLKLEKDNSAFQRMLYGVVLFWLLIGLLIWRTMGGRHLFLPSIGLLMAVYAEHLYPPDTWFSVFTGLILVAVFLSILRFMLERLPTVLFSRLLRLGLDLFVVMLIGFCASFVVNFVQLGIRLDFDSIVAVLQSNLGEMMEFALDQMPFWAWIGVVGLALIPFLRIFEKHVTASFDWKWTALLALMSGFVGAGLVRNAAFVNEFSNAYHQYYEEIEKFNQVQRRFKEQSSIEATKVGEGETYVVVIGESQSKEHMSLYGYHRNTTPVLDSLFAADELVRINNAYSCHTHTILVLQEALTKANQYNNLRFTHVPTLMNVLNAADFETIWLSNQVKLSNWDNVVSAIALGCDKQLFVNKNIGESVDGSPCDERVLPELKKILSKKTKKNRVVFVHLMGNHGKYDQRYPADFEGLPPLGKAEYGGGKDPRIWQAYDNSIRYNDWIVGQIHKELIASPSQTKALVYFADHGEDLEDGRGHNAGMFTYRMTQIPLFFWFSDSYKMEYPKTKEVLVNQSHKLFSNDMMFQTVLGVTHVNSNEYNSQYDLTSPDFQIEEYKIKAGKLNYDNVDNIYLWTPRNVDSLRANNLMQRVGIHRNNSNGKYREVVSNGYRVIELDVKIREVGERYRIEIGHGEDDVMSGRTLQDYVQSIQNLDSNKIWLDVKNLSRDNIAPFVNQLNDMDETYRFKSQLIVETSYTGNEVARLAENGYHSSYYLPTDLINKTDEEKRNIANHVVRQVSYQKLSAISFDGVLYGWVKAHLESRIKPHDIVYHTWDVDLNCRKGTFWDQLSAKPYFTDKRVKTILVGFPSVFNL